jgi:hypothetical protein
MRILTLFVAWSQTSAADADVAVFWKRGLHRGDAWAVGRVRDGRIADVDARALVVRNLTYALFVELGRAPSAEEVGHVAELPDDEVVAVWRDLDRVHALVLNPAASEIRMANPFSAVPTVHRVRAAGRWWYGNCAWDALGVCAALHADGRIETSCPDCGEAIALEVRNQRVDDERLLFHCLVPAEHWWDDISFT